MNRPILVVALNPALDITHELPRVDWGGVNRPASVAVRPGGKGLNVARTLLALGADVLVTGLAGGLTGEAVLSGLAAAGVPAAFTDIAGQTRRTFAVVDAGRGQTAMFNEPGPAVSAEEYARFRAGYAAEVARSSAVVLTGSLPPGLPPDTYAGLITVAAAAGAPAVLDTGGPALRCGVRARPAVAKPNLAELSAAVDSAEAVAPGRPATIAAARQLRAAGAGAVVVSMGAAGLLAVTGEGIWRATPPHPVTGNPTGAGDAVAAALAHHLVLGHPWPQRLRHAVALGSAAAAAPVAGEFSTADYEEALAGASVIRAGEH